MTTISSPAAPLADITDDDIRTYAYHLYVQSGCIPGRDLDNWLEAQSCVLANIPSRTSRTRLRQHWHRMGATGAVRRGFTMPASDAALMENGDVVARHTKSARKPSYQPRDPSGHSQKRSSGAGKGGLS